MNRNHLRPSTTMLAVLALLVALSPVVAGGTEPAIDKARVVAVDCDAGESLARALRQNIDLRQFWFTGTCEESEEVVIARNRVTLRGLGDAVLVGGIRVESALGVTLHDFAIRDSALDGVLATGSSSVEIWNLTVTDPARDGIGIENSTAQIRDVTVTGAGRIGIINFSGRVGLAGTIDLTEGIFGMLATHGAVYTMGSPDFVLNASNNILGVTVQATSAFRITGGTVTINGNAFDGLTVSASTFDLREIVLELNNNGGTGLFLANNGYFTFSGNSNAAIQITGNQFAGLLAFNAGNLEMLRHREFLIVDNPGVGLWVDRATAQLDNAMITGNEGGDVLLTFTSRVVFNEGIEIGGEITCQGPVYIDGDECDEIEDALRVDLKSKMGERPRF